MTPEHECPNCLLPMTHETDRGFPEWCCTNPYCLLAVPEQAAPTYFKIGRLNIRVWPMRFWIRLARLLHWRVRVYGPTYYGDGRVVRPRLWEKL